MKKLKPAHLKFLLRIIETPDGLPYSEKPRCDLSPFEDCRAINMRNVGRGKRIYGDPALIRSILSSQYEISDLEGAVKISSQESADKGEVASVLGNTKAIAHKATGSVIMRGIGADTLCKLVSASGDTLVIPTAHGVHIEIPESYWRSRTWPQSNSENPFQVLIVENLQTFRLMHANRLKNLGIPPKPTLIFWRSSGLRRIAELVDLIAAGPIFYYGDFDIAGIRIYETEVLPSIPESLLIEPVGLEELLQNYGSSRLYDQQANKYRNYKPTTKQGQTIASTISKLRRSLEQESVDFHLEQLAAGPKPLCLP